MKYIKNFKEDIHNELLKSQKNVGVLKRILVVYNWVWEWQFQTKNLGVSKGRQTLLDVINFRAAMASNFKGQTNW